MTALPVRVARLLLFGVAILPGQAPSQALPDSAPSFRADTRLVVCHTTVRDKKQRPVHDLPQTAFTVYEDGAQQQIRVFTREDVPVSLGLVIDNSLAMAEKRTGVVAASMA